jgi:HSP20 family protein
MKLIRKNGRDDIRGRKPEWVEDGFGLPTMFDDFITRNLFRPAFHHTGVSTPSVNIIETGVDFRLEMVAPGMKKQAFKVELQGDVLTISYDHDDNREGERRGWKYRTHEYNYHSFTRSFALPETVEAEKIHATYEDGILSLVLPKKEEARSRPVRQIRVE